MTNYEISQLTALTSPGAGDLLLIVDTADHSTAPAGSGGSDKKITVANLLPAGTSFTGAGFGVVNPSVNVTANQLYLIEAILPAPVTLTGLAVFNGGTAAGNILVAAYNAAGTSQLAASVSTAMSGTFMVQQVPFASPVAMPSGPCVFAGLFSSASAEVGVSAYASPTSQAGLGSFALPSTVTPPGFQAFTIPALVSY